MKVEVRAREFENGGNGLKGSATVTFDGCFTVHNINIVERKGDGNLFVSMPSYKTKQVDENGKDIYKDICFPITKEFRERLFNAVLTSFNERKPVMMDTSKNGQDHVLSDAVVEAMKEAGELPFDYGEPVRAGSPESRSSVKEGLADKIREAKDSIKGFGDRKPREATVGAR